MGTVYRSRLHLHESGLHGFTQNGVDVRRVPELHAAAVVSGTTNKLPAHIPVH